MNKPTALYLHIPFCQGICGYCDFTRVRYHAKLADRYLVSLRKELAQRVPCQVMETLYCGGGTPTSLSLCQLQQMFRVLSLYHDESTEFTLEMNPEAIRPELVHLLKINGVNRVSLGLQSCDDKMLKQIGRQHTYAVAKQAIELLQHEGIDNISVDLIYALPQQAMAMWKETLRLCIECHVKHLSLYSLTIEEHSEFGRKGLKPLAEEMENDMYFYAVEFLKAHGYHHYEISNFALEGYESRHNMKYWRYENFYGIGLGASGKLTSYRYDNTSNFLDYFHGNWIKNKIELTSLDQQFEMLMMNLRMEKGLELNWFFHNFKTTPQQLWPVAIETCVSNHWLEEKEGWLKATEQGFPILNTVLEEFL